MRFVNGFHLAFPPISEMARSTGLERAGRFQSNPYM
jgi:hypothetical protein